MSGVSVCSLLKTLYLYTFLGSGVPNISRDHPPSLMPNISITTRCADKPPGCAEYLGAALSAHPLVLSAHHLRRKL
jgi:hypothetical protein